MNTITKDDFLTMVKLQHLEVLSQEQLSQNTNQLKSYMEKALTSELSGEEIAVANAMVEEVAGFACWQVIRNDFSKAVVYTRREQVLWEDAERGEFGEIIKARAGVYKPTAENKKLGRVGQKYGGEKKEGEEVIGGEKSALTFMGIREKSGGGAWVLAKDDKGGKYSMDIKREDRKKLREEGTLATTDEEKNALMWKYFPHYSKKEAHAVDLKKEGGEKKESWHSSGFMVPPGRKSEQLPNK